MKVKMLYGEEIELNPADIVAIRGRDKMRAGHPLYLYGAVEVTAIGLGEFFVSFADSIRVKRTLMEMRRMPKNVNENNLHLVVEWTRLYHKERPGFFTACCKMAGEWDIGYGRHQVGFNG